MDSRHETQGDRAGRMDANVWEQLGALVRFGATNAVAEACYLEACAEGVGCLPGSEDESEAVR